LDADQGSKPDAESQPSTDANPTFITDIFGVIIFRLLNVIEIKSDPALRLEAFRAMPLAKLIR